MKNYTVRKYLPEDYSQWNAFISSAKNATFLFQRDFMEYHSDRFEDFSLIILDGEKWVAVLPANIVNDEVFSHQGLTYGGLVFTQKHKATETEGILNSLKIFLKEESIIGLKIKTIPAIYNTISTQELDYFLFQSGAVLYRRDMNLAIDLQSDWQLSKSKLKHFNKIEIEMELVEENDFSPFWNSVLKPVLEKKYTTLPVHTLEEITSLKKMFPANIRQFSAYLDGKILAGITIFESENVAKSQYGAVNSDGEKSRALDFLFINLIKKYKSEGKKFFDMGIVNENEGKFYNSGLLNQKNELGCAVFNHDFYSLKL